MTKCWLVSNVVWIFYPLPKILGTLHRTLLWHSVLTHADSPPAIGIRAISPIPCHFRQSPSSQLILRTVAGPKQPRAICRVEISCAPKNLWGTTKTSNKSSPTIFYKKTNRHRVHYDIVVCHAFGFCSSWSHSWAANQADSTPLQVQSLNLLLHSLVTCTNNIISSSLLSVSIIIITCW